MKKQNTFVIIASAKEAKIFEKIGDKNFDLNLLCDIEAELDSNHEKPGRSFESVGALRHGIEPHTDRREVERHKFAKKISDSLSQLQKEKHCDGLILFASHKMLEELDHALDHELKKKIIHKMAKELMEFTNHELKEYIQKNLI